MAIRREIKAKQQHVESLSVSNWLPKAQRFAVTVLRDAPGVPEATLVTAPMYIDVPALADKACKVAITPYLPAPLRTTVTFNNEATGEYLFYNLEYSAQEAGPLAEVSLSAPVRTTVRKSVSIANPLPREVIVAGTCTSKLVTFPAQVTLAPSAKTPIKVAFMPLLVTSATAMLSYKCAELGSHDFSLTLSGLPTAADATLAFEVALGRAETRTVTLRNFCPTATTYAVKLSAEAVADGFSAPRTIAAPAAPAGGADMELPVTFQPTNACEMCRRGVTLTAVEGGIYECTLVGRCTAPSPQGPVRIGSGKGGGAVPFVNPFKADAEFKYVCNNAAFAVKPGEVIKAQAAASIAVAYKEAPGQAKTAMLTVTCPNRTACQWVFYLEA
jgi:hydrocephalus-inducing protein